MVVKMPLELASEWEERIPVGMDILIRINLNYMMHSGSVPRPLVVTLKLSTCLSEAEW